MTSLHTITVGHTHGTTGDLIPLAHEKIVELCGMYFEGATIQRAEGFWKGILEPVTIVSVVGDFTETVNKFSNTVRDLLSQESVMVTRQIIEVDFI